MKKASKQKAKAKAKAVESKAASFRDLNSINMHHFFSGAEPSLHSPLSVGDCWVGDSSAPWHLTHWLDATYCYSPDAVLNANSPSCSMKIYGRRKPGIRIRYSSGQDWHLALHCMAHMPSFDMHVVSLNAIAQRSMK